MSSGKFGVLDLAHGPIWIHKKTQEDIIIVNIIFYFLKIKKTSRVWKAKKSKKKILFSFKKFCIFSYSSPLENFIQYKNILKCGVYENSPPSRVCFLGWWWWQWWSGWCDDGCVGDNDAGVDGGDGYDCGGGGGDDGAVTIVASWWWWWSSQWYGGDGDGDEDDGGGGDVDDNGGDGHYDDGSGADGDD